MYIMKKPSLLYCLSLLIIACKQSLAVVIPDSHLVLGGSGKAGDDSYDHSLAVSQNTSNTDTTAIFFNLGQGTLTYVNSLTDEASDWYVVQEDDSFNAANITSNQFTTFVRHPQGQSPITNVINISVGDFFLGVHTGDGVSSGNNDGFRNIFGWVKLNYDGSNLTYLDSAVAYNETGILVGANIAVPEPAAYALLFGGVVLALAVLRRKRL